MGKPRNNIASIAAIGASLFSLTLGLLFGSARVGFLPLVLSVPPIMIWLAASIFVYASVAHHPDRRVVQYNRWAGYRFYGATGLLVVLGQALYSLLEGTRGLLNWGIMA